jgi:hypothetical protein
VNQAVSIFYHAGLVEETHVIVSQMLQELHFSVRSLRNRCAVERLHHLLDGNRLLRNQVIGGTGKRILISFILPRLERKLEEHIPYDACGTKTDGL